MKSKCTCNTAGLSTGILSRADVALQHTMRQAEALLLAAGMLLSGCASTGLNFAREQSGSSVDLQTSDQNKLHMLIVTNNMIM